MSDSINVTDQAKPMVADAIERIMPEACQWDVGTALHHEAGMVHFVGFSISSPIIGQRIKTAVMFPDLGMASQEQIDQGVRDCYQQLRKQRSAALSSNGHEPDVPGPYTGP